MAEPGISPISAEIGSLLALMQQQMKAAEARETRLTTLVENATRDNQTPPSTSTSCSQKPISVERPVLLSTATMADFTAWEEAWRDYAVCQHLASQSRETRVSALRQAFDADIRRFMREDVIVISHSADAPEIIIAVKAYIRRQRNPLLDRIAFYDRKQQRNESFDSFFTAMRELFAQCDFPDMELCSTCTPQLCSTCPQSLRKVTDDMMRDRIVVGIANDDTRHKLLAAPSLTLETAAKICRAEEAAQQTGDGMVPASVNAATRSSYQRSKFALVSKPKSAAADKPAKCSQCGRSQHMKSMCPAKGKECRKCKGRDHFAAMCRKTIACLTIHAVQAGDKVMLSTRLDDNDRSCTLVWLPDTGSDVDAIGASHLRRLGGSVADLEPDPDHVVAVNGQSLTSLGTVPARVVARDVTHTTRLHVYDELSSALLSRSSLKALGFLPPNWPQIASVTQGTSRSAEHSNPTPDQRVRIRQDLLDEFADVFAEDTLRPMDGQPMHIQLAPDAQPFKLNNARWLPYAYRDQVKLQLDKMVADGIIAPVSEPTEWCHPIVIAEKKGTAEVRMTVDFTKLNKQVARPAHPMRAPRDVVSNLGNAQYFIKLDARHGYWQVPLDEESRSLTTFITQWGRYQYLRNLQGLISAGDEFNQRTDAAFAGIEQFSKVVDDCLVFTDSFEQHLERTREVLQRARRYGITLSAKKFAFAETEINFCGYVINKSGWKTDQEKTRAITDFEIPANRTDLRSFMGLVNQCSDFSSTIAEHAAPLRGLLKAKNEFLWLPEHTVAMDAVKQALVDPPLLAFFDPSAQTRLECDAARTKGLGFGLWQYQNNSWRHIQCGSRFITDTESRYAMIELEMLGVAWAIRKCHTYLAGMSFHVVVDHQPLVPILNTYTLDQVENPRLQRLMTKVQLYQFDVSWRKGSEHAFADALSRAPVQNPVADDLLGEADSLSGRAIRACLQQDDSGSALFGLPFHELRDAAQSDVDYVQLVSYIRDGFPSARRHMPPALAPYWNGREHLTLDNGIVLRGSRLVVPKSLQCRVLTDLHSSHQGLERTKRRARQVVYWPRMSDDITAVIRACPVCRELQRSQQKEPLMREPQPTFPFEYASADLFSCQGWQFLVYSDCLSGWPCVARIGRTATSHDIICHFRRWFADVGVPRKIFTDGGPQFAASRVREFCERWGVEQCFSTPHYPQSNGHAESAVKAVKLLIEKTTRNGDLNVDSFQRGLLEWRNTPRPNGSSPAQVLFGQSLQSFVFAHRASFDRHWIASAEAVDSVDSKTHYDKSARSLHSLRIGTHVDVQYHQTKLWSMRVVIVAIGSRRDYFVKMPSGRVLWRNRRFLRPYVPPCVDSASHTPSPTSSVRVPTDAATQPVRRSTRIRKTPDRLTITSTSGQSYV
ncbi:uncharacterized protein K02A2.6-like [Sycon ciliatum]|uniref:uncharacterized protein K02A2.6-like n=1 Tax=Sycon ciliatum TaxID=27933 RepID=UPI0031F6FA31